MGQNNDTREHGDLQGHQGGYPRKEKANRQEGQQQQEKRPGLPEEIIAEDKEGEAKPNPASQPRD